VLKYSEKREKKENNHPYPICSDRGEAGALSWGADTSRGVHNFAKLKRGYACFRSGIRGGVYIFTTYLARVYIIGVVKTPTPFFHIR